MTECHLTKVLPNMVHILKHENGAILAVTSNRLAANEIHMRYEPSIQRRMGVEQWHVIDKVGEAPPQQTK